MIGGFCKAGGRSVAAPAAEPGREPSADQIPHPQAEEGFGQGLEVTTHGIQVQLLPNHVARLPRPGTRQPGRGTMGVRGQPDMSAWAGRRATAG